MPGYSDKSLRDKLGLKTGVSARFLNPPTGYLELLGQADWNTAHLGPQWDFVHAFYSSRIDLEMESETLINSLRENGIVWVSWPKKSSGLQTDIREQDLRDILLPLGLVDIKVAAVTEIWSGLKFVHRKNKR